MWPVRTAEDEDAMRIRAAHFLQFVRQLPLDDSLVLVVCHGGYVSVYVCACVLQWSVYLVFVCATVCLSVC